MIKDRMGSWPTAKQISDNNAAIALATVCFQEIKTAKANLVESLKNE